jgi:hypothetical protein
MDLSRTIWPSEDYITTWVCAGANYRRSWRTCWRHVELSWMEWMNGSLFYDAFSVTRLYSVDDRVTSEQQLRLKTSNGSINEQWIGKNAERISRGLIKCTIPSFTWRDWGKLGKSSGQPVSGPTFEPVGSISRWNFIALQKVNTLQLNTIRNASRILTHVQLLPVL